jgi:hypothetical protein
MQFGPHRLDLRQDRPGAMQQGAAGGKLRIVVRISGAVEAATRRQVLTVLSGRRSGCRPG